MHSKLVLGVLSLLLLGGGNPALAFKEHDFKKCDQSGFCRRGRDLAARAREAKSTWKSPYSISSSSVQVQASGNAVLTADVKSALYPDIRFQLDVRVHDDGVVRVRMDEVGGLKKRYDEAAAWALVAEPIISKSVKWKSGKKDARATFGNNKEYEVVVQYQPLRVSLLRSGKEQVVLNGQGLLHMEHFRNKPQKVESSETSSQADATATPESGEGGDQVALQAPPPPVNPNAWFEGDKEDGWWEETFGSHTDTKPKGPESLSLDITFPNHGTVYGIPQHATRLALPTTMGDDATFSDPYRLYNADVFEYLASSPVSLYGSIPVLHAHSPDSTVGIFHAVGSETWIDIGHSSKDATETHWISESGILDLFLMPGPTPEKIFNQYAGLTGTAPLPAQWALGYHQCRWNYVSSEDVRTVQKRFDEEDMPVDVFWLDIEYADEHKYFIWDKKSFPDPVEMINDVAAIGRKMVVIVDPHLKRTSNYPVYQKASDNKVLVNNKDQNEYEGWCWSGSSSWIDFFNPGAWEWWKSLFQTRALPNGQWSWTQSTTDVHIWNDMNEPSVFNGPEITMPKDNIHYGGWEHRDVHNINGMLFSNLTSQAVSARTNPPQRPFVLTRSFYAGSQRFGAMWTGDNLGTWEHMAVGIKMVLSNGIAGMTFSGSDVGGFFGNPEPEMLVRWYQVGAFAPFFRAHAHIDTKRREPFLLDQPYKGIVRDILRLRYSMMPVWYTAFREASTAGVPVLRPQYVMFPKDKNGYDVDEQYYIGGSGLLVKPVTEKDVKEASVYIAEDQVYYDYFTHRVYRGAAGGKTVTVPAALHQIPLLVRGGSIVPTRERPRRASSLMKLDPFTLRVALDQATGDARGELYLDDGVSYNYRKGEFIWREFVAEVDQKQQKNKGGVALRISNRDLASQRLGQSVQGIEVGKGYNALRNGYAKSVERVRIEKVVVVGLGGMPSSVKVEETGEEVSWEYVPGVAAAKGKGKGKKGEEGAAASLLVIRDPKVLVGRDWTIVVN
ncbi:glycoside hydrolase family 31 protein [Amanita thiersii Skay4041]|uniref:Glucosidase II subunit alpha n=1 Tax=Amanita thiersii Skay4041 TaxID=703135 RepID=A0A2A9N9C3_9AGAR|nr:glycoside hydrolase family 31 protein [Amanita thiersii Skay4041]